MITAKRSLRASAIAGLALFMFIALPVIADDKVVCSIKEHHLEDGNYTLKFALHGVFWNESGYEACSHRKQTLCEYNFHVGGGDYVDGLVVCQALMGDFGNFLTYGDVKECRPRDGSPYTSPQPAFQIELSRKYFPFGEDRVDNKYYFLRPIVEQLTSSNARISLPLLGHQKRFQQELIVECVL